MNAEYGREDATAKGGAGSTGFIDGCDPAAGCDVPVHFAFLHVPVRSHPLKGPLLRAPAHGCTSEDKAEHSLAYEPPVRSLQNVSRN